MAINLIIIYHSYLNKWNRKYIRSNYVIPKERKTPKRKVSEREKERDSYAGLIAHSDRVTIS